MKRGCLDTLLFTLLVLVVLGISSYVSFNYFIRGRSVPTPNLVGKSVADAKAACADLGLEMSIDPANRRNSDKVAPGNIVWQNKNPSTTNLLKPGEALREHLSAG